ncbi:tetratricopeptide repeat protein [Saliniramus sp.]|uniref:tetratricopeptide repeat protein n=1 Tax=Saliniramus sp. TaxID=2986772 RepID=UPI002C6129B5|nr:tetratricopeptide repeat protein [Saliniramus sp.]HMB10188.1 tetratricopeptide repeat protein [Saliniramus sp.]
MRISRTTLVTLCLLLIGAGPALALDGRGSAAPLPEDSPFASVREALREGVREYNAGDKTGAVRALEFAAGQGHTLALWKLGSMYAAGDGVKHDDLRAFEYFSRIVDSNHDTFPGSGEASVVSAAFVALGRYFLEGIPVTYVRANSARAYEMFHYAASFFGDANAQYAIARLHLDGKGVPEDSRTAARWFNLAAEKGHYPAQAVLGHMLVNGIGVPRQRSQGLMWLTLARDAADPGGEAWIHNLYDEAVTEASETERRSALANLEDFLRRRR